MIIVTPNAVAVASTINIWLAKGAHLPELDRLARVTITDSRPDEPLPPTAPSGVVRALSTWRSTRSLSSEVRLSDACLQWAKGLPSEDERR